MEKSPEAFRTISEVAEGMDLPQHVLRFWETRFPQIKPLKRAGGTPLLSARRRRAASGHQRLLYDEGQTIKGVQKMLRATGRAGARPEQSVRAASTVAPAARQEEPNRRS